MLFGGSANYCINVAIPEQCQVVGDNEISYFPKLDSGLESEMFAI